MKHPIASRFVVVCALFAAFLGVGLMTSEAHAQRRAPMVQRGGYYGGGYNRANVRREMIRREMYRRAAVRNAPRWRRDARFGRPTAPRWQPQYRGRYSRGRW